MSLATIIDMEQLAGDYLRNHPDVVAFDARVAGQLPRSFTKPWIKVAQLDARNATGAPLEHLINYLLQLDAYASAAQENAQAQASGLSRAARAALHAMPGPFDDYGAVVTSVVHASHVHLVDMTFDPPRERYVQTVEIHAHRS